MHTLADSSSGLDAVTYFYASSALFFVLTAVPFFLFGLWLGNIIWGRYKRKFERSLEEIETGKAEIAQFKRRMADRPAKAASPAATIATPPPAPVLSPAGISPLAALVRGNLKPAEMPVTPRAHPAFPPGRGFSVWTEPEWQAPLPEITTWPPSAAFTLWTQTGPPDHEVPTAEAATFTSTHAADAGWLYTYEHSDHHHTRPPKSHAHTLWTDQHWHPHPVVQPPTPPAVAFSIWTLPDFVPAVRSMQEPGQSFSLWTAPEWSPPRISGPPPRSARGFSLWTDEDFIPTGHGPVLPSQAWTLWTAADWEPHVEQQRPQPVSAAFSLWMEDQQSQTPPERHGANGEMVPSPEPDPRKTQGSVFARALAAARAAFKGG